MEGEQQSLNESNILNLWHDPKALKPYELSKSPSTVRDDEMEFPMQNTDRNIHRKQSQVAHNDFTFITK